MLSRALPLMPCCKLMFTQHLARSTIQRNDAPTAAEQEIIKYIETCQRQVKQGEYRQERTSRAESSASMAFFSLLCCHLFSIPATRAVKITALRILHRSMNRDGKPLDNEFNRSAVFAQFYFLRERRKKFPIKLTASATSEDRIALSSANTMPHFSPFRILCTSVNHSHCFAVVSQSPSASRVYTSRSPNRPRRESKEEEKKH